MTRWTCLRSVVEEQLRCGPAGASRQTRFRLKFDSPNSPAILNCLKNRIHRIPDLPMGIRQPAETPGRKRRRVHVKVSSSHTHQRARCPSHQMNAGSAAKLSTRLTCAHRFRSAEGRHGRATPESGRLWDHLTPRASRRTGVSSSVASEVAGRVGPESGASPEGTVGTVTLDEHP